MAYNKDQAIALLRQGHTPAQVAKQLGTSRDTIRHLRDRMGDAVAPGDVLPVEHRSSRPLTLPDLIRYYQIDETQWEVQSFKANVWEQGAIGPDGKMLTQPLHQTSATFKRQKDANLALIKGVLEDIKQQTPVTFIAKGLAPSEGYLLEICIFDLHLAKLAWGEETGETYDLPIAVERARTAFHDLVRKATGMMGGPPSRILLPLGNDYFHYDHITGLTTAGTPQDRDSRYAKMFRTGRRLASEFIRASEKVAKDGVDVVVVPGNHDRLSCFTMGEVLGAEFERHPLVFIDNTPKLRKYVRAGQVLIGYTHGSDEKIKSLPQLMATEARTDWGQTRRHEWHLGHLHKRGTMETVSVNEEMGCVTRYISSLTGTDAWHYSKGYVGNAPAAEAFIWDTAKGHLAGHVVSEV